MKLLIFFFPLISQISTITFDCKTFGTFSRSDGFSSTYFCWEPIVSNINDGQTLTALTEQHHSQTENNKVKGLFIYNVLDLTFFPKGIENFLPNIDLIYIEKTGIQTLTGDEFKPFKNLYWLRFHNNKALERIPGNLLDSAPLIKVLSFLDNSIKHVDDSLFDGLTQLTTLDFRYNYCVNEYANTSSQISSLIGKVKSNCKIVTTTPLPTTTEEPCKDFIEIISILDQQNQNLIDENSNLKLQLDVAKQEYEELKTFIMANVKNILEFVSPSGCPV